MDDRLKYGLCCKVAMLVFGFMLVFSQVRGQGGSPVDWFKNRILQAVSVFQDPDLSRPEMASVKRQRIWDVAAPAFDEQLIVPLILEKTWPLLKPDEKQIVFQEMSVAIKWKFIGKMYKYGLRSISFTEEYRDGDRYLVKGKLGAGLLHHGVRFIFLWKNDRWVAYDMVVRGFSLIEHYRRKFDGTYFQSGVDGLRRHIRKELDEEMREMGF